MTKKTNKTARRTEHVAIAPIFIAAVLMVCVAVAGDLLFADSFHVAVYGPISDGYTPVQKSAVTRVKSTAATRAAKRTVTKPAAKSSSSSSIYSNPYPAIDILKCVKGNPSSCTEMVSAFEKLGNPACMFNEACIEIVGTAYATRECGRNVSCSRSRKMVDWYMVAASECQLRQPTLECKQKTDAWIARGMPSR